MLKYATIIAPLLLKLGSPNPAKTMTGYMGAFFLAVIAAVFFLAALFTWIASNYGLDVAFLTIALILTVGAIALMVMARVSQTAETKSNAERQARIKAMLDAREDPLADHIPEELLSHPLSQKILAQVEDKPFMASAAAIALGIILSRQIFGTNVIMTDPSKPSSHRPASTDRDPKTFDKQALPDKIGSSLRNLYDEVLNEDVPDDFLNLLRKADDKSSERKSGGSST